MPAGYYTTTTNFVPATTTQPYPYCTFPITDPFTAGSTPEWLAIDGPASDSSFGDAFAAGCYNGQYCGTGPGRNLATSGFAGYRYTITATVTGPLGVAVFDAGFYPGTTGCSNPVLAPQVPRSTAADRVYCNRSLGFTTSYTLYRQQTSTSGQVTLTPLSASDCGGDSGHWDLSTGASPDAFEDRWAQLCTLDVTAGDTYVLGVSTSGSGDGRNDYAVGVYPGPGASSAPAVIAPVGPTSLQVGVAATPAQGAQVPIAALPTSAAGKTLNVDIWDPGDMALDANSQASLTLITPVAVGSGTCMSSPAQEPIPPAASGDGTVSNPAPSSSYFGQCTQFTATGTTTS